MTSYLFYESIKLTEEEEKVALLEGKIKKYFREKNAEYWREKEAIKPSRNVVTKLKND